jgi:hypothetical protein
LNNFIDASMEVGAILAFDAQGGGAESKLREWLWKDIIASLT